MPDFNKLPYSLPSQGDKFFEGPIPQHTAEKFVEDRVTDTKELSLIQVGEILFGQISINWAAGFAHRGIKLVETGP